MPHPGLADERQASPGQAGWVRLVEELHHAVIHQLRVLVHQLQTHVLRFDRRVTTQLWEENVLL